MLQLHTTWPTPVSLAIMRRNNVSLPFLSFSRVSQTLFFHFFTATNNHIGKIFQSLFIVFFASGSTPSQWGSVTCFFDCQSHCQKAYLPLFLKSAMQPAMEESDELFILETKKVVLTSVETCQWWIESSRQCGCNLSRRMLPPIRYSKPQFRDRKVSREKNVVRRRRNHSIIIGSVRHNRPKHEELLDYLIEFCFNSIHI